jgi:peroxiredoxin
MLAYRFVCGIALAITVFSLQVYLTEAQNKVAWSAQEKPIADQIHGLRSLPDDVRARTTKELALNIRKLPASDNKLRLAVGLAEFSTEGDFGRDTLQEVTTTLSDALVPQPWAKPEKSDASTGASNAKQPAYPYVELATLVRYEHMQASLNDPQFASAMARLDADDQKRQNPDFTLKDLRGKEWSFKDLRGQVVLVNFWATWCPPCRKEIPDLMKIYQQYQSKGLIVLAISDEDAGKVEPFMRERKVPFPVLLDPGRKVNDMFVVEGIPKSFVYNREGQLVAQSIEMRTEKQFLEMLAKAGLE